MLRDGFRGQAAGPCSGRTGNRDAHLPPALRPDDSHGPCRDLQQRCARTPPRQRVLWKGLSREMAGRTCCCEGTPPPPPPPQHLGGSSIKRLPNDVLAVPWPAHVHGSFSACMLLMSQVRDVRGNSSPHSWEAAFNQAFLECCVICEAFVCTLVRQSIC